MAVRNPLDLPEFREALAPFLATDDLTRCIRVSKNWHTFFLPYLWSTIDIPKHGKQPNLEALRRHRGHVRHLIYQGKVPDEHCSLQFTVLTTLHIPKAANRDIEMVGNQPSLTHLSLHGASYRAICWNPPASLSSLTSLSLTRIGLDSHDKDAVWSFISKLETLELCYSSLSTLPGLRMGSCRIRNLRLEAMGGLTSKEQQEWIEHCPRLKRLTWIPSYCLTSNLTEDIAQLAAANTWPDLEQFHTPFFKASDRQVSLIINGMRRVLGFTINFRQPFDLVKTALRCHFPWLRKLIATAIGDRSTGFAIEILKSCPQLQSLRMGAVQVSDMLDDDTPWACESTLRYLGVGFKVVDSTREAGQRKLLERLSRLHNLERLNLSCGPSLEQTLDLRLESGLDQLVTLTRLQEFTFTLTVQKMTMRDIEWMIEHWKNLKHINGTFNRYDTALSRRIVARLREVGISTKHW